MICSLSKYSSHRLPHSSWWWNLPFPILWIKTLKLSLTSFFCTAHPNPCSAFKIYLEPKHCIISTTATPVHDNIIFNVDYGQSLLTHLPSTVVQPASLFSMVVKGTLLKNRLDADTSLLQTLHGSPFSLNKRQSRYSGQHDSSCSGPHSLFLLCPHCSLCSPSLEYLVFQSCFPYCLVAWNVLPPDIFMVSSLMSFRFLLKCYLLRKTFTP